MGWQDTSVPFHDERTPLNDRYHTPNMERLARMGVRFTQAYACAVSSPSRCSILSGMNAARHRVTNWTLDYGRQTDAPSDVLELPDWNWNGIQPDTVVSAHNTRNATPVTTLPQLLRENGYYTIHCGKAHFGAKTTAGADPLAMGFDVNIAGGANGAPGSYLAKRNFGQGSPQEVLGLEKYFGEDLFLTEVLTREAIEALKVPVSRRQPFYLYMAHYAVHSPYDEDARFTARYRGRYDRQLDAPLNESETRYAALVEGMDKSLGDLLDFLEQHPETARNTIILFMSDNGGQGLNNTRQGSREPRPELSGTRRQGIGLSGRRPRTDDGLVAGRRRGRHVVRPAGDDRGLFPDDPRTGRRQALHDAADGRWPELRRGAAQPPGALRAPDRLALPQPVGRDPEPGGGLRSLFGLP